MAGSVALGGRNTLRQSAQSGKPASPRQSTWGWTRFAGCRRFAECIADDSNERLRRGWYAGACVAAITFPARKV